MADQIIQILKQIAALLQPYMSGAPVPDSVLEQVTSLRNQADALAEGDAETYMQNYQRSLEPQVAPIDGNFEPVRGNAPPYPILYFAEVSRQDGTIVALRGETRPFGQYTLFVPRGVDLGPVHFYDPQARMYGSVVPLVAPNSPYRLPRVNLVPVDSTFADSDGDGVSDAVELVYGTSLTNRDSDGDGISDSAEIEQGTNPLDNRPARTGVIATADTPGVATDVCAVNDMAAVSDSTAGVSVFNVFNGMNPTIIAQADTPGDAKAVACSGNTIAVADGITGLALVDITDPPAARITHQIPLSGSAVAVATSAGIAYVGLDSGRIALIDLSSGAIMQEVRDLAPVHDLVIAGDVLFALTSSDVRSYDISTGYLDFRGSLNSVGTAPTLTKRRRIFAGGGYAYVTSSNGYIILDVRNPASMVVVGPRTGFVNSFKQIVTNGSGMGVAAVDANAVGGPQDVWLYDVSNPAVTSRLLTALATPGIARAVTIYNGLAFVADGESGFQVMGYLPYDANGVVPTLQLETNFPPGFAEERRILRLTGRVTDDVQVRNVEFFINGIRVVADGNFPFEHRFAVPLMSQLPSFTIRACASDTGGNRVCTAESTITVTADVTPPRVVGVFPSAGSASPQGSVSVVSASLSESLDQARLSSSSLRLFSVGPDAIPGTADDVLIPGGTFSHSPNTNTLSLTYGAPLIPDVYRAVVSNAIADLKGNQPATEFSWSFAVKGPNSWVNPAGGAWNVAANWSIRQVPGAGDDVAITLPGNYTVTITEDVVKVGRLTIGGNGGMPTLWVKGPGVPTNLTVTQDLVNDGGILLQAGAQFAGITVTDGVLTNRGRIETNTGGNFGDLRIQGKVVNLGTIDVKRRVRFEGYFTNSGTITVAANETLTVLGFDYSQTGGTISGAGFVSVNNDKFNYTGGAIVGSPMLLQNQRVNLSPSNDSATFQMISSGSVYGTIGAQQTLIIAGRDPCCSPFVTFPEGLVNDGTLRFDAFDRNWSINLNITTGELTNRGLVEINLGSGGSRSINGAVRNLGTFNVNTTASVSGSFHNNGAVSVAAGQQLTHNNQTFNQNAGSISGAGVLRMQSGIFNFNGGSVTEGILLLVNSDLNLASPAPSSFVMTATSNRVHGNLAQGQTLLVRGSSAGNPTNVTVDPGFTNAGTIRLESEGNFNVNLLGAVINRPTGVISSNQTLGGPRFMNGNLTNEGTFNVNVNTTLTGALINSGSVNVAANQKLTLPPANGAVQQNAGSITGAGILELNQGIFEFNGGTITGSPASLINATLKLGTSEGAASFVKTGSICKISGRLAAAQSVWIRGSSQGNQTALTVIDTLTNAGNIRVESIDSTYNTNLVGSINNLASGTITINQGSGGGRNINGTLTNQGTLSINNAQTTITGTLIHGGGSLTIAAGSKMTLSGAQTFTQNGGTIGGAGTLELVSGATFNFNGGTISGIGPMIVNSTLNLAGSSSASFVMSGSSAKLNGNVAAGQTLWIRGSSGGSNTILNSATSFTNAGTLRFESIDSGFTSNLTISPAGTLTNTGTIEVAAGTGGGRTFKANVTNRGLLRINTTMEMFTSTLENAAGGIIEGNGTVLLVGTVAAFNNGGQLNPGSSPAVFSVTGPFTQVAAGVINAEIGGLAAGTQYDQLKVSAAASLSGTLNITRIGGYEPALGDVFDVVTYGSRTGTFTTINGLSIGNGKKFSPTYSATKLTLTVVPE